MAQDEVLICRRCKVTAQIEHVDNQIVSITCPSCGVLVEVMLLVRCTSTKLGIVASKKYRVSSREVSAKTGRLKIRRAMSRTLVAHSSLANRTLKGYRLGRDIESMS